MTFSIIDILHYERDNILNIFVLSNNPEDCAKFHCDKHVVKMILESAQMLMSAYYYTLNPKLLEEFIKHPDSYKLTHKNHPCTIWTRTSLENWKWLYSLMYYLNIELKTRYNWDKKDNHKSYEKLNRIISEFGFPDLPKIEITPFAIAMPKELINQADVVESYRRYYIENKKEILKYTNREVPSWISKKDLLPF